MRLTLRTLLAFLDGILEPEDAQDIGKKIEESEYATKLMHRTRDVMRRLRLAAPSLADRSPGLDPNTVAEYLDNTLSVERVPDFEKVCLESDMHLAEVACCHQILTLVLGEPAEIDLAVRQKMYQLPHLPVPAESRSEAAQPGVGPVRTTGDGPAPRPRLKPEIPDYLREPRRIPRWLLPVAAALLLMACLGLLMVIIFGQLEPGAPLAKMLGLRAAEKEVAGQPASDAAKETGRTGPAAANPVGNATATPQSPAPPARTSPALTDKVAPAEPREAEAATELVPPPPPAEAGRVAQTPIPSQPAAAETPAAANLPVEPQPAQAEPSPPVGSKIPPEPIAELPGGATGAAGKRSAVALIPAPPVDVGNKPPEALPPGSPPATEPPAKPAPEAVVDEPSQPMGRLMSDRQVLLKYDSSDGSWRRVRGRGILAPQDRLLALPTYRPEITLGAGVTLQMLPGTQLELLRGTQGQPAGLKIMFGRVVVMPLANAGRLGLVIGECKGVLAFAQAESVAALEVTPLRVLGADPQTEPVHLAVNLYVASGEVLWNAEGDREPVRVTGPGRLSLTEAAEGAPLVSSELPKWIASEPIGPLDARASRSIEEALQADRPAQVVLMELDDHRQREVRWLASRCEAYLGRFDSMVAVLNQPDAKPEWLEYIDKLRDALVRGPDTAAAIRAALDKQYQPQDAADLYRMLWGYSEKDLQDGADAKLVKFLEHETLAIRLLSFVNLREITGMGLYYSPEQSAAKRQPSVVRWKKELAAKKIKPRSADVPAKKGSSASPASPSGAEAGS